MSSELRRQRVGDQVRAELANLLASEVKDPRVGFVTVTEVRMSRDLRHARVYVSVLGDDEEETRSLEAIDRMGGWLRSQIGNRIRLRHVPELDFVADRTLKASARIEELLRDNPPAAAEDDSGEDDD